MPRYKCGRCKTRLYSAASAADLIDDRCAECGLLLELVTNQRTADPIDDFIARREASLARTRLDLEGWVDQQVADRVGHLNTRREAISLARSN